MKYLNIFLLAWFSLSQAGQGIYVCKNARISLYSSAPIEDIEAISTEGVSVFNASTGELSFSVPIRSFHFRKTLMEDHFNEDYMESDKYREASFKGKLDKLPDISKDGSYPVTVTGGLQIHGVLQTRTIRGVVKVDGGLISMTSEFTVACAAHRIDIPQIVFHNIAENITMHVAATYAAYPNRNSTK
jgi:hypothetical protein